MKKYRLHIFLFIISSIATCTILYLFGGNLEQKTRHIIRAKILHNDTLAPTYFTDSNGIPYVNYYSILGQHVGIKQNPLEVCKYGLNYYSFKKTDTLYFKKYLNCSDWLLSNAEIRDSSAFLYHNYPKPNYGITSKWLSAMTHGKAILLLVTTYKDTKDEKYLDLAEKLIHSFYVPVEQGGITYKTDSNSWFYEEYAFPNIKKPYVLMGMLDALIGINTYYEITQSLKAKRLFENGTNYLKENISMYSTEEYQSRNDLIGHISNEQYHKLHIEKLSILYQITNENLYKETYEKWMSYSFPNYIQKSISQPNKTFVLLCVSIFLLVYLLIFKLFHPKS